MMTLPEILQLDLKTKLKLYEEGRRMPFLTSFERDGIMQGKLENSRENVIELLEMRFGILSEELKNQINALNDLQWLKSLHKQTVTVAPLQDFEQLLAQNQGEN